jgi:hypothetical protein
MKLSTYILFFFLLLDSCITPYEINTPFQEHLVVEGLITDQPGPYQVKISKTVPIQDQLYPTTWVAGATLTIQDDQGNSEALVEKSPGNYYTKAFQGVLGRSYWLNIATNDGNVYQSTQEKHFHHW